EERSKLEQKVSKHKFLVVFAAQTSHVLKVTVKERFHCIHFVLTLVMHMKKQIRHTVNSVSKQGSTVEKIFLVKQTTSKGGNRQMLLPNRVKNRSQHRPDT